jgi:tripartite-type tricarboxylate transporter receptor subunit TctC
MKKFLTLLLLSLCLTAQSRDIPAELTGKNITVIVPYGPGGNSDITARQLAKTVEQITGLNIMVINRPGASGTIGTQALTQAVPNGLTLGQFETGPAMVNTIQGLPNAPSRDQLVPVSASIESSLALIVGADTPANTVQEFVLYLRQQKQLSYATTGGIQVLMSEAWLETARVPGIQPVTYKSQAETLRSVAANETAFVLSGIGDAQGLIDAKKVKVLAVGGHTRSVQHPNIPTLAEIYNGFVTVNYNGVFAPRGTPIHILEYFNWAWNQAVVDSESAAALIRRGNVPLGGDLSRARQFYNTYYDSRERLYKKYQHLLPK